MVRKGTAAGVDCIAVAVSRFGSDPVSVRADEGATVEDVLTEAGITLASKEQVFCNGETVDLNDEVENEDVLSIVTPKAAGSR